MSCSELIRSLLRTRDLQAADGRPLYAYRLSADERDALEAAVLHHYRPGDPTPFESMAFCLWAAIRLARSAPDQVNTWVPVGEGLPGFRYVEHYLAVRRGLNAWRRELLLNVDERLYLVTLACEGGLPLRILEDDDARVTRFFRELLREHETFPGADLSMLARRSMDRALPKTLRNHVVGDLASRLIRSVAAIRRDFTRSAEREAALRGERRGEIPLDLDEQTGRILLDGLLRAPEVTGPVRGGLPELEVILDNERLELARRVRLPRKLPLELLAQAVGAKKDDLRGRMILRLELHDGSRHAVAALTGRRDAADLEVDPYPLQDIRDPPQVRAEARLVLDDGVRALGQLVPHGAAELPEDLPWSFAACGGSMEARLIALGRATVAAPEILVCIPPGTKLIPGDGAVEARGMVLGRPLFAVRGGDATWISEDGTVSFRTGQPHAHDDDDVTLSGRLHELPGVEGLFWHGVPSVVRQSDGQPIRESVRVRKRGTRGAWAPVSDATWGDLDLRVERQGAVIFGAPLAVLPREFSLALSGESDTSGSVRLGGCHGIDEVGVTPVPGLGVTVERNGAERVVALAAAEPPATFELVLAGRASERLRMRVAFPRRRRGFTVRGRPLPDGAEIALADLPYARAEVLVPGRLSRWELDVTVGTGSHRLAELPAAEEGRTSLHLTQVRDAVGLALQTSVELDHKVRLVLSETGQFGGAKLHVRRYETKLVPVGETQIGIDPAEAATLQAGTLASLRADALPLSDPALGRHPLREVEPGVWEVADPDLPAGPWLVLVWQGEELRGRPILRTLRHGEVLTPRDRLSEAMTVGHRFERRDGLHALLAQLVLEPEAPEWALIRSFLKLLPEVPACALDALVQLSLQPEAAALAALHFGREAPERVLRGLEQLPFLWEAVPLERWVSAARRLETVAPQLRRLSAPWLHLPCQERPWLQVLHGVIATCVPVEGDPPSSEASFGRTEGGRQHLVELSKERVNDLRCAGESRWWPTGSAPALEQLERRLERFTPSPASIWAGVPAYVEHVVKLPWLLALAAVTGEAQCASSDVFAIRSAQVFDAGWFAEAHALALAHLVGWQQEHREGLYRG